MPKKFNCKICNYSTDIHCNYKKHLTTKRHIGTKKNIITKCEYCQKKLADNKGLKRHQNICKKKNGKELEKSKDEIIRQLMDKVFDEKKGQDELTNTTKKLIEKNENLQQDIRKFIKKLDNQTIDNTTINNNNQYNMYYVINNFNDAYNYEDLMAPPLTEKEKAFIIEIGASAGCYKLLNTRCIENIDVKKRPFHCTDLSRNKYMLRKNNDWVVDPRGEKILDIAYPLIKSVHLMDESVSIEQRIKNMEQIIDLENKRKRIICDLNKKALLKNNMK